MSRKPMFTIMVLLLLVALCFSGCTNNASSPTANQGEKNGDKPSDEGYGILKNATSHAAKLINPHEYTTSYESGLLSYSLGTLYSFFPSEDGTTYELSEELAIGDPVQVDSEGKVWQITLNKDAKWSNGEPLTVDDFIYSWQMLLDPKLINHRASNFAKGQITIDGAYDYFMQATSEEIGEVKWEDVGIKKVADNVIEITSDMKQQVWDVKYHFSSNQSGPVYKPLYESLMNEDRTETSYGTNAEKYMSCGAFYLESWVKDSERMYKKNPYYVLKDKIWIAGVLTRVIKDSGTQMQLFESGELDYVSLNSEDYLRYEEDPRVLFSPSTVVRHLPINIKNPEQPILGNKNFRKALFYAMDRATLADLGKQIPANYIVSSRKIADLTTGTTYRSTDLAQSYLSPNFGYDPELALDYFNKALEEEGLEKVSLQMNYYETREDVKKMSEYMQSALPKIFGEDRFELKLQSLPNNQLFATMKAFKDKPASYEISWTGWSGYEFAPWAGFKVYTSDYKRKNEPFFNEEFDALYERANFGDARYNNEERVKLIAEMEKILLEELPFIPIFQPQSKYLKAERVQLPVKHWVNGVSFGWRYSKIVEE